MTDVNPVADAAEEVTDKTKETVAPLPTLPPSLSRKPPTAP